MLRVHPDVAKVLKASDNQYLEEIEEILGRPVLVRAIRRFTIRNSIWLSSAYGC